MILSPSEAAKCLFLIYQIYIKLVSNHFWILINIWIQKYHKVSLGTHLLPSLGFTSFSNYLFVEGHWTGIIIDKVVLLMCEDYVLGSSVPWFSCLLVAFHFWQSWSFVVPIYSGCEKTLSLWGNWHLSSVFFFANKFAFIQCRSKLKIYSSLCLKNNLSFSWIEPGSLGSKSRCSCSGLASPL